MSATYAQLTGWIKNQYGSTVKSCWIADVKSAHGLTTRRAPNREGEGRLHPCPAAKRDMIESALRHFKEIE